MQSLRLIIARNSLFMIGSQIALKCLSIVFSIVIVRKLGDHDFGVYSTVGALVGITAVFSDMGIAGYAMPDIVVMRIADLAVLIAQLAALVLGLFLFVDFLLRIKQCLDRVG